MKAVKKQNTPLFAIILVAIISYSVFAKEYKLIETMPEETIDSIDIRALVKQQIENAQKASEGKESTTSTLPETNNIDEDQAIIPVPANDSFDPLVIGSSIVFLLSLTAAFLYFIKKNKKAKEHTDERKEFKNNIKKVRTEKRIDIKPNHLQSIRSSLLGEVGSISGGVAAINYEAKRRSIAKGELYLAAKIKSFELSKIQNFR